MNTTRVISFEQGGTRSSESRLPFDPMEVVKIETVEVDERIFTIAEEIDRRQMLMFRFTEDAWVDRIRDNVHYKMHVHLKLVLSEVRKVPAGKLSQILDAIGLGRWARYEIIRLYNVCPHQTHDSMGKHVEHLIRERRV